MEGHDFGSIPDPRVLAALCTVIDPELGKDLVSLGMVKDIIVQDGRVEFTLELTSAACPLRSQLTEQARQAVLKVHGIKEVQVNVASRPAGNPTAQGNGHRRLGAVIAVASGKGGVGKSTVSVNLALALAETGARVGLIDADIYGPNIPIMMGVRDAPGPSPEGQIVPVSKYGVKLISIGFFVPRDAPVIWRGPLVASAIQQFLSEVDWGELDYTIVDLPPGTGDVALTLAHSIPLAGAIIVTTPQDVALEDATRGLLLFQKLGVPVLGIVENMSFFNCPHCQGRTEIFGHGGAERTSRKLAVPFLGQIPLDGRIRECGDAGEPVVRADSDGPQAEAFRKIARAIACVEPTRQAETAGSRI